MSEWQPIETAPVDTIVRMGYWDDHSYYSSKPDDLRWRTETGVAVSLRFGFFGWRVKTSYGSKATHWMPLPEPPRVDA